MGNAEIRLIILAVLLLYLGAMWIIGVKSQKYTATYQSTILAGGKTTLPMLIGSAVGGHIGSGFVVGGAEYGAAYGIGGAWYGLGCGLSLLCLGLLMAKFVYRRGYISLSDYFLERYKSRASGLVYLASNLLGGVAMFAGQLLAGKAIFHIVGIDGTYGLIFTAVISLVYATVSGLWGAMATAMLQSAIILAGIIASAWVLLSAQGAGVLQAALPASYFEPLPFDMDTLTMLTMPTILSALVSQPFMQRIVSAKDEATARRALVVSGLALIPAAFLPVVVGMYGRVFYPEAAHDQVFSQVVMEKLPTLLAAVLLASIICAVMSACNSMFIAVSTMVTHDLFQNILRPDITDQECKRLSRMINVALCVVGVLIATVMTNILELLALGATFVVAGNLIPFFGGLLWKKGTAKGALASSVIGIGCIVLDAAGLIHLPCASISPLVPALLGYVAVSKVDYERNLTGAGC